MYFGIVKDIIDPSKLGRVKVNVYGIHDNIATKDLGWSNVLMPANTPAINGIGHSVNLLVGTLVSVTSLDPKMQEFLVTGSLPTKTDVTIDDTDIDGEAVTTSTHDNNTRVRGGANPHINEPLGTYEPGSSFAPIYPYNNVMETESGHVKEYDDTPGAERIKERHKSGTQYEIAADGSKVQRVVSDNYQLVCGHDTVEVHGNVRIIVSGHCDLAVAKDLNAQVGGNMSATITGNSISTITGNSISTITGNMTASIQGTTSLIGINEDGEKLLSIDFDNSTKKITLDSSDVEIKGNLKVFGTTHVKEDQLVDDHTHTIAWTDPGGSGNTGELT
jgi:hypothetical protein